MAEGAEGIKLASPDTETEAMVNTMPDTLAKIKAEAPYMTEKAKIDLPAEMTEYRQQDPQALAKAQEDLRKATGLRGWLQSLVKR